MSKVEVRYLEEKTKINLDDFKSFLRSAKKLLGPDVPKNTKVIFKLPKDSGLNIDSFYDEESFENFKELNPKNKMKIKMEIVKESKESNPINKAKIKESSNGYSLALDKAINETFLYCRNNLIKSMTENILQEEAERFKENQRMFSKESNPEVHKGVLCRQCFQTEFEGKRFVCSECDNYNLCEICEKTKSHCIDHVMIQINRPIINEIKVSSFNNEVLINRRIIKYKMSNKNICIVPITLINSGSHNDWIGCYLNPINYFGSYLGGKTVHFEKNVDINHSIDVNLEIKVSKPGNFKSKWRMFCKEGLPFGKVIDLEINVI